MKISEYLQLNSINQRDFAKNLGVSQTHINLIANGKRVPSLRLARLIIKETKGKVNVADLFEPESEIRLFSEERDQLGQK